MAIAAIVLLLIAGLAVTGQLSLPAWFDDDDPSRFAAPSLLTEVETPMGSAAVTPTPIRFSPASGAKGSEEVDPFSAGFTVTVTRDGVNLRSEPSINADNIITVLDEGTRLIVLGPTVENDGDVWLPVFEAGSGVEGFVMVEYAQPSLTPAWSVPTPAVSPAPDSVAVLFIVDKSGSMSYDPLGNTSKLEWEKETIRRVLATLPDRAQVGVLAFNDQFTVAVPMTPIENDADRQEVARAVDAITADGGSELQPALLAGFELLLQTNTATKHAILLSDGKARDSVPSEVQRLVQTARAAGITFSVIAVGDDADTALLQFLAETGGGRYHLIQSPDDIPTLTLDPALDMATPAAPAASPSPQGSRKRHLANVFSPWSNDQ